MTAGVTINTNDALWHSGVQVSDDSVSVYAALAFSVLREEKLEKKKR